MNWLMMGLSSVQTWASRIIQVQRAQWHLWSFCTKSQNGPVIQE